MSPMLWKAVLLVGILLILHSAIGVMEFGEFSRATESTSAIPSDLVAETLLGLLICIFGAVGSSGQLLPIRSGPTFSERPFDSFYENKSFRSFNTRRKASISAKAQALRADKKHD